LTQKIGQFGDVLPSQSLGQYCGTKLNTPKSNIYLEQEH